MRFHHDSPQPLFWAAITTFRATDGAQLPHINILDYLARANIAVLGPTMMSYGSPDPA
jgi:hypothetical protein